MLRMDGAPGRCVGKGSKRRSFAITPQPKTCLRGLRLPHAAWASGVRCFRMTHLWRYSCAHPGVYQRIRGPLKQMVHTQKLNESNPSTACPIFTFLGMLCVYRMLTVRTRTIGLATRPATAQKAIKAHSMTAAVNAASLATFPSAGPTADTMMPPTDNRNRNEGDMRRRFVHVSQAPSPA